MGLVNHWDHTRISLLSVVSASALVVGIVVGLGSWQGCNIYGPWLLLPDDAAVDAAPSLACQRATWVGRTDAGDELEAGQVQLVAAMRSINIGVTFDAGPDGSLPPFGWDLDGVCTCPGPPSCAQRPGTPKNCDDNVGRDHVALQLFRDLGMTAQAGSAQTNAAMS